MVQALRSSTTQYNPPPRQESSVAQINPELDMQPRMTLNAQSSCLYLPSAGTTKFCLIFFFNVYRSSSCMQVYEPHECLVPLVPWCQKRVLDALELELYLVITPMQMLRIKPRSSVSSLNHRVISLSPQLLAKLFSASTENQRHLLSSAS